MPRSCATPWRRCLARAAGATLLAGAAAAHATDFRIGLGGGADHGRTDCVAGVACDHDAGFGKIYGAVGLGHDIDLQLAWFDAGRFKGGDTTPGGTAFGGDFHVSLAALSGAWRWAFAPDWSLEGRAGVASVRTRFSYAAPFDGSVAKTTTQPLLGVGLGWSPAPRWRLSVDLDATRFEAYRTHGSLRLIGVAAETTF